MGPRSDSLISLLTFSSRGSKKSHARANALSHRSPDSTGSVNSANTFYNSALGDYTFTNSPHFTISSEDLLSIPIMPVLPVETMPEPNAGPVSLPRRRKAVSEAVNELNRPEGLQWELLHEVLHGVSPDYPDFFAVFIDSTEDWYKGYLFKSDSELRKLVELVVRRVKPLGEPAREWLFRQPCNGSLKESVRITSLQWLLAIPGQRMAVNKLVQLIDELRRLKDVGHQVRFMNQVNSFLGLPVLSRSDQGDVMPVGKCLPLDVIKQQFSGCSSSGLLNNHNDYKLEEWLPRDIEVQLISCRGEASQDRYSIRMHVRHVTPQGSAGKRVSADFDSPLDPDLKCAFKHLLPASPSLIAKVGRLVLICEVVDDLTSRCVGFGTARMDSALLPESLDRSFVIHVCLFTHADSERVSAVPSYKSLITGGATGLKIPTSFKEITLEVVSKGLSHPSVPAVISTTSDYFNQRELLLMEFGELVILKQSAILTQSANDPFLIRVEDREVPVLFGQDVGLVMTFKLPLRSLDVQLLNGSTVVACNNARSHSVPIAAQSHRIPLMDVETRESMIGFVNVRQFYMGREQHNPPAIVSAILGQSTDLDLSLVAKLGLSDLKLWAGPMLTSLLDKLVTGCDAESSPNLLFAFKAFLQLLALGMAREIRYLFEQYSPPRRLLAAPVAFSLLQQYCFLLEKQDKMLNLAFRVHLLLGHFLNLFDVSQDEFRPLTQAFMAFFSDSRTLQSLSISCLRHLDELYVVNTSLEIASQIGSVLISASYGSCGPIIIEFYWLLARVAQSHPYHTVFASQFSSLVLSLTERFWNTVGHETQALEEIRAVMALIMFLSDKNTEAAAFLSLSLGVLVVNEPNFKAVPNEPFYEPHRDITASLESERATAVVEICLVIFELTDSKALPSRTFLKRLETPLDFVYQLCSCANIMADSVAPNEWMSLSCVLMHCALRCVEYAGSVLELVAMPETTSQANLFDKNAWGYVLQSILDLVSDPRINRGMSTAGITATPLQRFAIDQSIAVSGMRNFRRLWSALACGGNYGGYQVQFYEDHQIWATLLLLGFNADHPTICSSVSSILGDFLDGQYKLYGASAAEALKTIFLSLDYMFHGLVPTWRKDSPSPKEAPRQYQFRSVVSLIESLRHDITEQTLQVYGDTLVALLNAFDVLRTYWSERYSSGTLLALWGVVDFFRESDAQFMLERYFEDGIMSLRAAEDSDEKLAVAYFEAACFYSTAKEPQLPMRSVNPELTYQSVYERQQTFVRMSLQQCCVAKSWRLAEYVMDTEAQWLKERGRLEERSNFVTEWLPIITAGFAESLEQEHNYYLVQFNGAAFGSLSGQEFVWETHQTARLSDALHALSAMFNEATCLPRESVPKFETEGSFIAVLSLSREGGEFVHMRPAHDQLSELSRYETATDLPSVSGFREVSAKYKTILAPEESALRDIRGKTEELDSMCSSGQFKQLDLVLSGILNAGVNGGIGRYAHLLNGNEELMEAFRELKYTVDAALEIYGQQCGEELQGQYYLLRERAHQWENLKSLEQGFI